jgi:aarF domain-containing kinase
MNKLIRAFADQIFVTGFVHCDPHPGNVFVRPHPLNKKDFQVVILDHGLCLDLPNQFRKQYS